MARLVIDRGMFPVSSVKLWPLFPGVSRRMACCRVILLAMTMLGMIASRRLWLSSRDYPMLPVTSWFPSLPAPWDGWLLGMMLISLVLACWCYRGAVLFF